MTTTLVTLGLTAPIVVWLHLLLTITRSCAVNVVDGELLHINKVSRLHMTAYLCVASNGVPPSISKRVQLRVQCKCEFSAVNL